MFERIQRKLRRAGKHALHELGRPRPVKSAVVVVVGVQRSGTNMVMEVFDRSWRYAVFHDNDPRAFVDFQPRSLDEIRRQIDRKSADYVALKPMTEMHRLRSMLDRLVDRERGERGVGLWVLRRMGDVVNSHIQRWTGMPDSMRRLAREPDWQDWRAGGLSPASLDLIRRHATDDLNNATACALFWFVRNVQFFEQGYDSMDDVMVVPYETVVADPVAQFRRLFQRMDVPFRPAMARHVNGERVLGTSPPEVQPEVEALCDELERRFVAHLSGDGNGVAGRS